MNGMTSYETVGRIAMEHAEAIAELNARGTSHLITMQDAVQRASLERDQARAAHRRTLAELLPRLAHQIRTWRTPLP